ncbi:unnamed protein product [Hydatigera taeniaeformis]|uniref:C2H2-type domain-containing protein n=1 Tax=Hydatigena taeniaeformis TaxID=6205 RepID=A0A0R3XAF9_HYDTA|nr:unnamed protein product [Hydatigera taeniaeformis]
MAKTDRTWECEFCYDQNSKCKNAGEPMMQKFASQEDLVQHIMHHHLLKRVEHGRTVFVCTYGPSGLCSSADAFNSQSKKPATFDSEYDYERHLVTRHIIGSGKSLVPSRFRKPSVLSSRKCVVVLHLGRKHLSIHAVLDIFSRYWGDTFEREPIPSTRFPIINRDEFLPYLNLLSKRKSFVTSPHPPAKLLSSQPNPLELEEAKVYCSPDFDLSSPETFNRVIPLYRRGVCPNLVRVFTQQSDQLSQYLDAVELAIVNHVSERSPAFFEAVREHDVVKDQLSQTISGLNAVR